MIRIKTARRSAARISELTAEETAAHSAHAKPVFKHSILCEIGKLVHKDHDRWKVLLSKILKATFGLSTLIKE